MFERIFSYKRADSWVNRMRRRRFLHFFKWIESLDVPKPVRVLDFGGTYPYWKRLQPDFATSLQITLMNLNLSPIPQHETWIRSIRGDVRELSRGLFQEHDVLFSNSLIEHLGCREAMENFSRAIIQSGLPYCIQTPSYWFPLEPHCRIPCFQFLPRVARAWLIYHGNINYFPGAETYEDCKKVSDSTILLKKKELSRLFPGASIETELLMGLPKSYTVYHP